MKKSIRILLVIPTLELGGAERQAIRLAKHLQKNSFTVEVWGFNSPNGLGAKLCNEFGIKNKCLHFYGGFGRFRYPLQVLKYVIIFRSFKPDIIYSFCDGPNVLCGLVWKLSGAKKFIWGQRSSKIYFENKKLLNKALTKTRICISNSKIGIQALKKINFSKEIEYHTVRNGIQPKYIQKKNNWKKKLNLNSENKIAIMIANFSEKDGKDHKTLIKAWKKVLDKNPKSILLLAGRINGEVDSLIKLSTDLEILQSIRFLGKVENIEELITITDLIVHSSVNEGTPNALLEGMKYKKPIVATNIPGIKETLPSISHKYLSEIGEVNSFAKNIITFFKDTELSKSIGFENYKFLVNFYSVERMVEETIKVFNYND